MVAFNDKKTTQKGDIGEIAVDNFLRSKGIVPYMPVFDGAHPFDRLCALPNKKNLFITEVKAKSKRKYYDDTGFNIRHYNEYLYIFEKYKLQFYICFVDEDLGEIYGGKLNDMRKEKTVAYKNKSITYPFFDRNIVYFYQPDMEHIAWLDDETVTNLRNLTTKNKAYTEPL